MLFVPPSMPAVEAQDSEIPAWIKNNAGWWAEGKIRDNDFVKGIEFLMDNLILYVPTNKKSNEDGVLRLNSYQYELPNAANITTVDVFGKFSGEKVGSQIAIKVIGPDGKINQENIRIPEADTVLSYQYKLKSDFPLGEYQITASAAGDIQLGPISFTVTAKSEEEKTIPFWIKNTAGWWATSSISDAEFVNALQFLVKENIIKIEQKVEVICSYRDQKGCVKSITGKSIDPDVLVYRTKLTEVPDKIVAGKLIKSKPFVAIVVYSTQDKYCSGEEKRKALAYAKMTEYLLNKLPRQSQPTEVIGVCMELHEIKGNTYPFTLKVLGISSPKMVIFVGGLEANLESYDDKSAVGWWSVDCAFLYGGTERGWSCVQNQIVVCDECERWFTLDTDSPPVNSVDFDDAMDRGMWTLAHEIGHSNHYEKNGAGVYWDGAFYRNAYATSIHDNQRAFDYCYQQGLLENELCKKLYEKVKINEKIYTIMNINYAINNWKGEQKDVLEAIEDLVGTGASVEGFNKKTYTETYEKDDAGVNISKDIFSIEYPDDPPSNNDYEYHWFVNFGNGTTDPKEQESEFYHDWQTDSVLEKFVIWLNKSQSCTECPAGYEYSDSLADTIVYFFENIRYAGNSDTAILATIEGVERNWCIDSSRNTNGFDCLNFKVRDKSVYQTDEGRKAYTVEYEFTQFWRDPYEPLNFQIKKEPKVYTATEIHDGDDAWHISTWTHKDIFDKNPDQFYHFIESFRLLDYNTPP